MFVASLTDQEVETLLLALKFWRYHRRDSATRRQDHVLSPEEAEVLVAKLNSAHLTSVTEEMRSQRNGGAEGSR
ncbi:MAG TPA: hypothetical protein VL309_00740 [Vicinamibacterales bacterium]|jgi:hypothetical protein|nr:hypothetical protein [Vicinamibacterales bacterium]